MARSLNPHFTVGDALAVLLVLICVAVIVLSFVARNVAQDRCEARGGVYVTDTCLRPDAVLQ